MRIELFEKLVLVLAGLAIVAVGGLVVTLSIMPLRSGIPKVVVDASLATQDWLQAQRRQKGTVKGPGMIQFDTPLPAAPRPANAPPPAPGEKPAPAPVAAAIAVIPPLSTAHRAARVRRRRLVGVGCSPCISCLLSASCAT